MSQSPPPSPEQGPTLLEKLQALEERFKSPFILECVMARHDLAALLPAIISKIEKSQQDYRSALRAYQQLRGKGMHNLSPDDWLECDAVMRTLICIAFPLAEDEAAQLLSRSRVLDVVEAAQRYVRLSNEIQHCNSLEGLAEYDVAWSALTKALAQWEKQ